MMGWALSHRFDPSVLPMADRHYSRQKPGTPQFVAPGRCLVLKRDNALWVTSWPFAEYTHHAWAGAWINSTFRNEGPGRASDMIREAVAVTRWKWPEVPALGMVTFIDPKHVKPRMVRGRPTWGYCYFEAGFHHVGYTKSGLWAFRLPPDSMPAAMPPELDDMPLFAEATP